MYSIQFLHHCCKAWWIFLADVYYWQLIYILNYWFTSHFFLQQQETWAQITSIYYKTLIMLMCQVHSVCVLQKLKGNQQY